MSGIFREAVASARSQPVASSLTVAMVAGMCVAVLLTTGRTVPAEQAVLARIDEAGTSSIIVRVDPDAGVTVSLLDRLQAVQGIEALAGFGPTIDVRNAAVPGATKIALRNAYGSVGGTPLFARAGTRALGGDVALASSEAATALGFHDGTGALITDDGSSVVVVGDLVVPRHLNFLEPPVVVPSSTPQATSGVHPQAPLAVLVALADSPAEVAAVEATVRSYLRDVEPGKVTIETSAGLAAIRAAVGGELGRYGRGTVLGILAISAILVAANLLALVMMRRKDFGRRRALGAKRSLVASLLLVQVSLLAVVGGVLGASGTLIGLAAAGDPLPAADFAIALVVAGVVTAVLSALPPAVFAARRDPLHELRVP